MKTWSALVVVLGLLTFLVQDVSAQRKKPQNELGQMRLGTGVAWTSLNDYQIATDAGLSNGFGVEAEFEGRLTDHVAFGLYVSGSSHDFWEGDTDNVLETVWYLSATLYGKYYARPIEEFAAYIRVGAGGTGIAEPDEQVAFGKGYHVLVGWGVDYFATDWFLVGGGIDVQMNYFFESREFIQGQELLFSYTFRILRVALNFDF